MSEPSLDIQHHPVVLAHRAQRRRDAQLRADAITASAGSLPFIYIHAVAFVVWMLTDESNPWPKLTLIVSLEAIFLTSIAMIGPEPSGGVPAVESRP